MSLFYLGLSVIWVLLTLNLFWPVRFHQVPGAISFALAWPLSALALPSIGLEVAITAGFYSQGWLETPAAQLGMLLAVGAWSGRWVFVLRALALRTDVTAMALEAVREGATRQLLLGPGVPMPVAAGPGLREQLQREPVLRELWGELLRPEGWGQLFNPVPRLPAGVERVTGVEYARDGDQGLHLDIYRSKVREGLRPVLLHIHGGAWVVGSRVEQGRPLMHALASRGWVCVSIDYRLSPRATWPAQVVDVKRALKWIREHIAEYGGDGRFVVATGGSAGGHLCALTSLTAGDPAFQPGFEGVDTSVAGCIACYGVYDFTNHAKTWPHEGLRGILERFVIKQRRTSHREVFEQASPVFRIHPEAPPFLVIHGSHDTMVPVAEARQFVRLFREKARAPVMYLELPGAQHAFDMFMQPQTAYALRVAVRFAEGLYRQWQLTQRPALPEASSQALAGLQAAAGVSAEGHVA